MNRAQRKYGRIPRFDAQGIIKRRKKNVTEILEVWPPKSRRDREPRAMQSRCCYISPEQRSVGQLTEGESDSPSQCRKSKVYRPVYTELPPCHRQYQTSTSESHHTFPTYHPVLPNLRTTVAQQCQNSESSGLLPTPIMMKQLQEIHQLICACARPTVENSSQYYKPVRNESKMRFLNWQPVENTEEMEKLANFKVKDEETLTKYHSVPKDLHISDIPRVKPLAVKLTKYKKGNIELRRVDEKVVCVEYDVFDKEADKATPVQKLRAFFAINQEAGEEEANASTDLPPTIKSKFNISTADLQQLSQKEIEIIDGNITENRPYLQDLRKILRRRENSAKTIKNTLNLQALYEMGKRDLLEFDNNFDGNGLSEGELVEMQNLILQNCKSSIHGIRRKTVKNNFKLAEGIVASALSKSLVTELMKESKETVTLSK